MFSLIEGATKRPVGSENNFPVIGIQVAKINFVLFGIGEGSKSASISFVDGEGLLVD